MSNPPSPRFCVAKRKKERKGKMERVSKQKLLKGCHQFQNVTILAILGCLEFKKFSLRSTILFNISWPLHFEIHFVGLVKFVGGH